MKKYLVIQAARFGDLVQSGRLIFSLEREAETWILLDEALLPLGKLLYPRCRLMGIPFHGSSHTALLPGACGVLNQLEQEKFDLVFNLNFSHLTASVCRLFEPERVVGYRPQGGGLVRSPWARLAFGLARMRRANPLNLVDFWAYFVPQPLPALSVNPIASGHGGGIGVVVAGREARRSIPIPTLASLVQTIFKLWGQPHVYLLGTQREAPLAARIMRCLPGSIQSGIHNLCGKTNWHDLVHLLGTLDGVISPDTGIMHLAARLGTPVYAFFFSSAWCHETGPYGIGHHIWQIAADCSPCLENVPCSKNDKCRAILSSQQIVQSFGQVLADKPHMGTAMNSGIQIWQSSLDDFGAKLTLIRGEDEGASARHILKDMICGFLGEGNNVQEFLHHPSESVAMWRRIFTDSDWMLPPWRYC